MDLKADSPKLTIQQIKKQLNIESLSLEDLKVIVNKVVDSAIDLVKEKEMRAIGPLMGEVMKEVRGKIDGKIVSDELKKAITIKLEDLK